MSKISYLDLIDKIKTLTAKADLTDQSEAILDLPTQYVPNWIDYVGSTLSAGTLVAYGGIKYLVIQSVTPIASQTPDMTGMLAIYKPYQGKYDYDWIYGEYSEVGFTRYYNEKLYTAIQGPGANIYSPDLVPSIWEEVPTTV